MLDASAPAEAPLGLCQRCKEHNAKHNLRSQKLCDACLIRFIHTKPIKRLEALRGNIKPTLGRSNDGDFQDSTITDGAETYLLALSGGSSSLAMLHALDTHIESMIGRSGRSSYALKVLYVGSATPGAEPVGDDGAKSNGEAYVERLRKAFPRHEFSYKPLSSVLEYWTPPTGLEDPDSSPNGVTTTTMSPADNSVASGSTSQSPQARFLAILSRAASPTARADLLAHLLTVVLESTAREHDLSTILRGDSTTRLAERTLTDTAKGRGGSVPFLLAEKPVPLSPPSPPVNANGTDLTTLAGDGTQPIYTAYPMRDLLRRDILPFVNVATLALPPSNQRPTAPTEARQLSSLLHPSQQSHPAQGKAKPKMMRDLSIDELVGQYFSTVEAGYPGVVSNVVRTVGKLDVGMSAALHATGGEQDGKSRGRCGCCGGVIRSGDVVHADGDGGPATAVAGEGMGAPTQPTTEEDKVSGVCRRCRKEFGL